MTLYVEPDEAMIERLRAQQHQQRANGHAGASHGAKDRKKLNIRSARDLRRMVFEPIKYVVPGFVAEGCTLLAGRPKLGKSWMVLEMGLAVATGGVCLGSIACEPGEVLYLALEDNDRRMQSRIDKVLGAFSDWPEAFHYATAWSRANEGGLDDIEEWIRSAENPRIVIVDVLMMFRPTSNGKENPYQADYLAIKGLQELASRYGIAIVVVHHTKKGECDGDPFEKVSGTLGLSGAADTTLILDRDAKGATLYGRGRDIEEIESAVEFNKGDCRWVAMGQAAEVYRSDERTRIIDVLKKSPHPLSPREVADLTCLSHDNVRQLLTRMAAAGEITRKGYGRYCHNDCAVTAVTVVTDDDYQRVKDGGNEEDGE